MQVSRSSLGGWLPKLATTVALVGLVLVAALTTSAARPQSAEAFSATYCGYYLPLGGSSCRHGNHNSITYNQGRSRSTTGLCVAMITEAGNVRGEGWISNNGRFCTLNTTFVSECFKSPTPMSQGYTYPLYEGKTIDGAVDNSTNHTGCY